MYGTEKHVLLRHYLEQGMSKAARARVTDPILSSSVPPPSPQEATRGRKRTVMRRWNWAGKEKCRMVRTDGSLQRSTPARLGGSSPQPQEYFGQLNMFEDPDPYFVRLTGLIPYSIEFSEPEHDLGAGRVRALRGLGNVLSRREGLKLKAAIPRIGPSVVVFPGPDLVGDAMGEGTAGPFWLIPESATGTRPRRQLGGGDCTGHLNLARIEPPVEGALIT